VTESRANPDLVEALVAESFTTLRWMREHGVRFQPSYGRQAFQIDGKFQFWGGLAVEVNGRWAGSDRPTDGSRLSARSHRDSIRNPSDRTALRRQCRARRQGSPPR